MRAEEHDSPVSIPLSPIRLWAAKPKNFSILAFLKDFFINEPGQKKFPNLAFLCHASPSNATYEGVTPCALA
jgi:hypothetical protein